MALYYTQSTDTKKLARILWDQICTEKSCNPLHTPRVVVPNTNLRKWLNLHLSESFGIVSHIKFSFLEKTLEEFFLRRSGFSLNPAESPYPTQDKMQKQILGYLIARIEEPEFKCLGKLMQRPSRIFGFSRKLALLFRDYEINRREWIQIWWEEKRRTFQDSSDSGLPSSAGFSEIKPADFLRDPNTTFTTNGYYAIEKKIYSDLFLPETDNPQPKTLTQWLYTEAGLIDFANPDGKTVRKPPSDSGNSPLPSLHLFCLSQLGYGYLEILDSLSKTDGISIYFYQFHSPLSEPVKKALSDSPEIFRSWQRPQEIIKDFFDKKNAKPFGLKDPEPKIGSKTFGQSPPNCKSGLSFLKSLIDSIPTDPSEWKPCKIENQVVGSIDGSVRIWNAPSVYREMEAVCQDILHKLRVDSSLTYEDFAVLVTDMSLYKPAVEWALDGGCLMEIEYPLRPGATEIRRISIPYSLTDFRPEDNSYLFIALQELWKICKKDRIDLQSFKRLLLNPYLFSHLKDESKKEIVTLLDSLQVKYEESGREDDFFLISWGVLRARLGAFFTNEKAQKLFKIPVSENTSEEIAILLTTLWEELLSIRKTLIEKFAKEVWTKENLSEVFLALERFFRLQEEDSEIYLFRRWKENLSCWEGFQIPIFTKDLENSQNQPENRNLRRDCFELLTYITMNSFQSTPYQVGDYLTRGVNVSLLQPMRPIPFRHIYILGLGEGKFPGRADRSEMNLLSVSHIPERDITRRELQEAIFWETLHSAQESLTLSYVGMDLKTDKRFEPCSTLMILMDNLGIEKALEIPVHRYSERYSMDLSPQKDSPEVRMGLVSYDYSRIWKDMDREDKKNFLNRFSDPSSLARNQNLKSTTSESVKNKYFLSEIIRYFRDPLSDYMNRKLRVYRNLDEESPEEEDSEIFYLDPIKKSLLIREFYSILGRDLADSQAQHFNPTKWKESWSEERIRDCLETVFTPHRKSANFPQRVFSKVQIAEFVSGIQNVIDIWESTLWGRVQVFVPYLVLGSTGLRKPGTVQISDHSRNPVKLLLNIEGRTIQILHEWETCFQIANGHWLWIYPKSLKNEIKYDSYNGYHSAYWSDHSLIFFSLLVARILGIRFTILNHKSIPNTSTEYQLFGDPLPQNQRDSNTVKENRFPFTKEEALEYLSTIIRSFEKEELSYFSPINFLRFVTSKNINKNRYSDAIWNADDFEFQSYLLEDKESALSELPDPISLYSDVESILEKMSLSFAKEFYKPLLQLYSDTSTSEPSFEKSQADTDAKLKLQSTRKPQNTTPTKKKTKK